MQLATSKNSLSESATRTPSLPQLCRPSNMMAEWADVAADLFQAAQLGIPRGPVTGLKQLDAALGGALVPGLHYVHGQPGIGKTAFALQVATSCQCPALYVSTEMSRMELLRRIVARATSTNLGRLKSGELPRHEAVKLLNDTLPSISNVAIADATMAHASIDWIEEAAETTQGDEKHLLIVIDYVQSWAEGFEATSEYEGLNRALALLRQLAARLNCSILAISEMNRASARSGGMRSGAGSRKIEYGAESLMELRHPSDRDEVCGESITGDVEVELKILKNRNGTPGKVVDLVFTGRLQSYREPT